MIYKITPIFIEKMWAGTNLNQSFNKNQNIGEVGLFSSIKEGDNYVNIDGNEITISELFTLNQSLFNVEKINMQLRIVDAKEKLSVQLHPRIGLRKKDEAWYILSCENNSNIIYGTSINNKKKIFELLENDEIEDYLHKFPTKEGDFIQINAGTIHAIGANNTLIEICEPSNTTFRFYDYNRTGLDGKKRELHINQALENINFKNQYSKYNVEITYEDNIIIKKYHTNTTYEMSTLEIFGDVEVTLKDKYYIFVSLNDGIIVNNQVTSKYDAYLICNGTKKIKIQNRGKVLLATQRGM